MKGKILEARRNGHDTYVTKQTKYGTFHGKVTCAAEDFDVENDLDGYTFAENKCNIQVEKKRSKYFEQRALGVRHAYNVILKSGVDEDDPTLKKLLRQVKIAEREAALAKNRYNFAKSMFDDTIISTIEARRKVKDRKLELIGEN